MFNRHTAPAAMPRNAAFAGATQYVGGGRVCPPQRRSTLGRSLRGALEMQGVSGAALASALNAAYAAHKGGAPIAWPQG